MSYEESLTESDLTQMQRAVIAGANKLGALMRDETDVYMEVEVKRAGE